MSFQIIKADISTLAVDAIVNPTDDEFSGAGNTDLAVHTAAGIALREECDRLPALQVGDVAVTGAYALPCKHIIHTVGPLWNGGKHNEPVLLRSCYLNAMLCAKKLGAASLAFPLISSGTFGFPKDQVLEIAIAAIHDFQQVLDSDMEITLCVFDRQSYELSRKLDLEQFLDQTDAAQTVTPAEESLEDRLHQKDDTFAVTLLKLIDKKGMTDVECYKKAQVTKNTFWKINNNPSYRPSKQTVLSFAIALELTLTETEQFLKTVGFSLSHSSTFDMIVEFYIANGIYDLYEINAALYRYGQVCLGC